MMLQQRVTEFWAWFSQNSQRLHQQLTEGTSSNAANAVREQLGSIFPELLFELYLREGKPCLELAPMGDPLNRIVTRYLVGQAPPEVARHWTLHSARTAKKGELCWNGITLGGEDITVIPLPVRNSNKLKLCLLCDKLAKVGDKDRFAVTYLMLYEYLGEELCEALIQEVEYIGKATARRYGTSRRLPLSRLDDYVREQLGNGAGAPVFGGLLYEYYSGKPQRGRCEKRYDIVEGYTALMPLAHEYYDNGGPVTGLLEVMGILPGYLSIPTPSLNPGRIEEAKRGLVEQLGESGTLVGFAQGEQWCYLDLLLYSGTLEEAAAGLSRRLGGLDVGHNQFRNGE